MNIDRKVVEQALDALDLLRIVSEDGDDLTPKIALDAIYSLEQVLTEHFCNTSQDKNVGVT